MQSPLYIPFSLEFSEIASFALQNASFGQVSFAVVHSPTIVSSPLNNCLSDISPVMLVGNVTATTKNTATIPIIEYIAVWFCCCIFTAFF